jgi:hypothetical protein
MPRHYSFSVHTCNCGDRYSGAGFAKYQHRAAHVRRGHAKWVEIYNNTKADIKWLVKNPPSIQKEASR